MRSFKICTLAILLTSFIGCASTGFLMAKPNVISFGQFYPAKEEDSNIDVYNTIRPDRSYTEIAEISCADTDDSWNLKQILIKARGIGADGIIIIGRTGSYGVGVPIGNMTYMTSEEYGMKVIAIKYNKAQ